MLRDELGFYSHHLQVAALRRDRAAEDPDSEVRELAAELAEDVAD